jgi:hypothetical protein
LLDKDESQSDFYLDKGSVQRGDEGIVTVRVKALYSAEGRKNVLETLKKEVYRSISHSLYTYGINCDTRQSKLLQAVNVDQAGAIISQFDLAAVSEWEEVPEDSRLDLVQQLACPKK